MYTCARQLIKMLGSWPLTSDAVSGVWSDEMWELEAALNTAFLYESFPFFVVVISPDDRNSSSYVITVCPHISHIFLAVLNFFLVTSQSLTGYLILKHC